MRYGTIPVVRRTGGLADSVVDTTPETLTNGLATGFVFDEYSTEALLATIDRALAAYRQKSVWRQLQKNGMEKDFSWAASAHKYIELYTRMLAS
jgi:starch synthase